MKLIFRGMQSNYYHKKHPPNLDRLSKINDYKYMYNKRLQVCTELNVSDIL